MHASIKKVRTFNEDSGEKEQCVFKNAPSHLAKAFYTFKLNEMKRLIILTLFTLCAVFIAHSQDTFSIVAVDSITGEVGSAGASCVDLYAAGLPNDDFLGKLIPNVGAINTQAYYLPANQNNATNRMNLGETPSQIIDWLIANDVQSRPDLRQYGIAEMV